MAEIIHRGQSQISTNSGSIRLEQGENRLVVYNGAQEIVVIDAGGFHFNDELGNERTRLDELGLTTIRANGEYANRVGQAGDDNRDGIWTANDDEDLKYLLGG